MGMVFFFIIIQNFKNYLNSKIGRSKRGKILEMEKIWRKFEVEVEVQRGGWRQRVGGEGEEQCKWPEAHHHQHHVHHQHDARCCTHARTHLQSSPLLWVSGPLERANELTHTRTPAHTHSKCGEWPDHIQPPVRQSGPKRHRASVASGGRSPIQKLWVLVSLTAPTPPTPVCLSVCVCVCVCVCVWVARAPATWAFNCRNRRLENDPFLLTPTTVI